MSQRREWMPRRKNEQIAWMQNFVSKLPQYQTALGLTNQQRQDAMTLAMEFVLIMSEIDQAQVSMKSANEWRQETIWGASTGKPPAAPPVFPVVSTPTVNDGIFEQLSKFRDLCMAMPGFTTAIGEDLGLLGQQISPRPPSQVTPDFRVATGQNYTVTLTGSLQGTDAVRVQYSRDGVTFTDVGFLTNTPGSVTVSPAQDGKPEMGHIRTVFVKKNQNYGNFSPDYPVTIY